MSTPYYALQSAFNAGEISADVLSRTDLDKYQFALSKAENVIIKPYGGISKRFGTKYIGQTKYSDKEAILVKFSASSNTAFMLECGHEYIRIWKDSNYTNIELTSPWQEADLKYLRFTQSANTMFICSKKYPVQVLKRITDTNWSINDFEEDYPYFDQSNTGVTKYGVEFTTPGTHSFIPKMSGRYKIEISGGGGGPVYYRKILFRWERRVGGNGDKKTIEVDLNANQSYSLVIGAAGASGKVVQTGVDEDDNPTYTKYNATAGGTSSFSNTYAGGGGGATLPTSSTSSGNNGTHAGNGLGGSGGYYILVSGSENSKNGPVYSEMPAKHGKITIAYNGNNEIRPSAKEGLGVEVTAKLDTFSPKQVGGYIKLTHDMPSITVSAKNAMTETLVVGHSWKVSSHGIWSGSVTVEKSSDAQTWTEYRKFTSNDGDYNALESGSLSERGYIRVSMNITGGTCMVDLTAFPYVNEGYAKITEYISPTKVKVNIKEAFGKTDGTENFAFSVWSDLYGYPACSCFFQDRLVFAANALYPYMVWMSRTGDYYNFKVEKADGKVLDDSAVALPIISREQFNINHIVPSQDLIILTDGNEWILSGGNVVTPTNSQPKMQTSRGSNESEPQIIGNRVIYVQRRGGTVRDMGYTYESDNYVGDDLTQLAKHFVNNYNLTDSSFAQEPYSIIYFIRSDGVILCLTYIREQKVYAWSKLITQGIFESVTSIPTPNTDQVYTIVKRSINGQDVRYIELFEQQPETNNLIDYCMVDSAVKRHYTEPRSVIPDLYHLIGEQVQVLADGRLLPEKTVNTSGEIELELPATDIIVGLQYTTMIQQPNFEIQAKDGTLQGRNALVSNVTLRLENSIGGQIGTCLETLDDIGFDEVLGSGAYSLFSGDKQATLPSTFSTNTQVCIKHNQPYPFNINAIIRQVTFGG